MGALVVVAACGSRVAHDDHLAVATGQRAGQRSAVAGAFGGGSRDDVPSTGVDGATAERPGAKVGASTETDVDAAATPTDTKASGPTDSPTRAPVGGGVPIRIGMVGDFTGVIGAAFAPARDAFKAWVGMVNARGGVNGHPIELYVGDDGGDAGRDLAIAKDFVENRKVIALVNFFPTAGGAEPVAKYAETKGIPIVGGETIEEHFYRSPMMFPQTTGFQNWYYSHAKLMADQGLEKVAIVYCTEAAVCENNKNTFRKHAQSVGLEIVYEARISLAQPDFTAECINAQAAGAAVYYPVVDGNSANRLARSCARQGYKPRYFAQAPVDPPDPALEGAISTVSTFPWFIQSGSPALEEYGQAMQRFAKGAARNSFTTFGWNSGKLFELAAANVSADPKPQDIFDALWQMKGETLGGLAAPMTFVRGRPAPEPNCAFYVEVKGGKWTAPMGMELTACR